jgi:hypothetical protein
MTCAEGTQTLEEHPKMICNVRGGLIAESKSFLGKEACCVHLLQMIRLTGGGRN